MPPNLQSGQPPVDWTQGALAGIGLATVTTDTLGRVLTMNPAAESLTGWSQADAAGRPLSDIFKIENEATHQPVKDPVAEVLAAGAAVALSDHTILIDRDGRRWRIDHGAAPIRDTAGNVVGAVLIFCDVSERQRVVQGVEEARAFAEGIVQTVREPLVILDAGLRVLIANRAFYRTFRVAPPETEGQFIFALGNRQWDIPRLRELLEQILPRDSHFDDFEVEHQFDTLGRRSMVLNARRLPPAGGRPELILLAIEDATERRQADELYRDLFDSIDEGFCVIEVLFGPAGEPTDFRYLETNPAFEMQSGLRAVTGKRVREVLPDIEPQWIELYGKVATTGEPVRATVNVQSLTNNWFDIYAFRRGGWRVGRSRSCSPTPPSGIWRPSS
jgi:PAS domain S-box-containing protein